ncbi:MAG: hypothetical protein D6798_07740 [Deltaproteobacteria bacterium]|nr:MAG: hypothetical protein D6798_07740 [Deltaproteobacteria bacterium]
MLLLLSLLVIARAGPEAVPAAGGDGDASARLDEADRAWAVATSRMLGAAGTVRDRAWNLGRTADSVITAGRIGYMSALSSDVHRLDQAVASAQLAAEVLAEAAGLPPGSAPPPVAPAE